MCSPVVNQSKMFNLWVVCLLGCALAAPQQRADEAPAPVSSDNVDNSTRRAVTNETH